MVIGRTLAWVSLRYMSSKCWAVCKTLIAKLAMEFELVVAVLIILVFSVTAGIVIEFLLLFLIRFRLVWFGKESVIWLLYLLWFLLNYLLSLSWCWLNLSSLWNGRALRWDWLSVQHGVVLGVVRIIHLINEALILILLRDCIRDILSWTFLINCLVILNLVWDHVCQRTKEWGCFDAQHSLSRNWLPCWIDDRRELGMTSWHLMWEGVVSFLSFSF